MADVSPQVNGNGDRPLDEAAVTELVGQLRRKEGTWKTWGKSCQQLQTAGMSPQQIFEVTGFEPVHQNQLVIAHQVYNSMLMDELPESVQTRFEKTGSDTLYEFRILSQRDRLAAATVVVEKGLDSEAAREVTKALKEFSRLASVPEAFPDYPMDAVAYYYWKLARQQRDLQARSRLIAQGLRFAASDSARKQIETLLTDFSIARVEKAPLLPVYRLETESEVPRVLPVVGQFPLTADDLKAVPMVDPEGAFNIVKFSGVGAWVPMPGWQIVNSAEDPVAILVRSDRLPNFPDQTDEEVMLMVDRASREWDAFGYFLVEQDTQLEVVWSAEPLTIPILGRVVLVLRPKKVLDESYNKELWQIDE